MSKNFFGFAFSASMLPTGTVNLRKEDLTIEQVRELLPGCKFCLNPSHAATIAAAREKFKFEISIPEKPARISLDSGDAIVVMQVSGLPRLTDRHEYMEEEIASANFNFVRITVL